MIPRKSTVTCQGTALGAVLLAVAPLSGCGGGSEEPGSSRPVPPGAHLVDLDRSEPEALRLEQDLLALLLEPLARGDLERASRSLDEGDFADDSKEGDFALGDDFEERGDELRESDDSKPS